MMLLTSIRLRSAPLRCRSFSRRRPHRVIRAQSIQKPPSVESKNKRVFDNVDEISTSTENNRSVAPETAQQSRDDADDWLEDKQRSFVDWGTSEKFSSSSEAAAAADSSESEHFKDEGNSYYKASSISVLSEEDKERVLPLIPLSDQASFYSPKELSAKMSWWGAALCGCVLFANSAAWISALSLSVPLLLPWTLAGLRNWDLQSNGATAFMGIWHCQVLTSEMLDAHQPVQGGLSAIGQKGIVYQTMIRLTIGDPWSGGARTEMIVPVAERFHSSSFFADANSLIDRDAIPSIGELCDLVVLSRFSDFREFKAVREAFFPRTRVWLAEYPFINRDNFYRLVCAIQRQQTEIIMDHDHW